MKEIELSEKRILGQNEISHSFFQEDKNKIKAAIFYSIFSTQRGLQVKRNAVKTFFSTEHIN